MVSRWTALLVWALVAACGVFWGLKLFAQPLTAPPQTQVAAPAVATGGDLSRLFGAEPPPPVAAAAPPPPPESSRFQLIGVLAAPSAAAQSQGVALIAVDGKLPRAFKVGAVIDGEHVLKSVQPRAVAIGPRNGVATVSLELPPLPPPATGVPTPVMGVAAPGAMPAQVFVPPPGAPVVGTPIVGVPAINNPNALRLRQARGAAGNGGAPAGLPGEPVQGEGAVTGVDPRQQR
jgi:general secretion pathway protein C